MGDAGLEHAHKYSGFRVSRKCAAKIRAVLADIEFADALGRIKAATGTASGKR
jgi:hypothetical protein